MIAPRESSPAKTGRTPNLLRSQVEQAERAQRERAVRALLRKPLLLPDGQDAEEFILVRHHSEWLRQWFAQHAGWSLVVTPEVARLRKTPGNPEDTTRFAVDPKNGEPFNRCRYVLLCLSLSILERSDRQITLGRLVEQLPALVTSEPSLKEQGIDFNPHQHGSRRDIVHVLRYLISLGILRRVQGNEERFVSDQATDVLYNVVRPVLATLLAAPRSPSLLEESEEQPHAALLREPIPETRESRNRAIRLQLIRCLLDDPVLYYSDLGEEERSYLDKQRHFILRELEEATGLVAETRAEGIALADLYGDSSDLGLPEEGTDGHLTLLLATWMAERLRTSPQVVLSMSEIISQTARFIREHQSHWRKEVREPGAEKTMTRLILPRLEGLGLIQCVPEGVIPRAAIGRFALRSKP